MATSVLTLDVSCHVCRIFCDSRKFVQRNKMNTVWLISVFLLGIASSVIVNFLNEYYKSEALRQKTIQEIGDMIENRRQIFEKSKIISSIPDESQISVIDRGFSYDANEQNEVSNVKPIEPDPGNNVLNMLKIHV